MTSWLSQSRLTATSLFFFDVEKDGNCVAISSHISIHNSVIEATLTISLSALPSTSVEALSCTERENLIARKSLSGRELRTYAYCSALSFHSFFTHTRSSKFRSVSIIEAVLQVYGFIIRLSFFACFVLQSLIDTASSKELKRRRLKSASREEID